MSGEISMAHAARIDRPSPKAVVFDVGRVLYEWDLRALFAKEIANRDELDWFLANVVTEEWHFEADAGRRLDLMVAERKALFPDYGELIEIYAGRFVESLHALVEGTHELVEKLSRDGVPLYALSNFGAEFWQMFRPQAPIFDHFSALVISGEEKCVKPGPRIYEILEARVPHKAQELFFIDDRADNIAAAEARGWHGHVFTDAVTLSKALKDHRLL